LDQELISYRYTRLVLLLIVIVLAGINDLFTRFSSAIHTASDTALTLTLTNPIHNPNHIPNSIAIPNPQSSE